LCCVVRAAELERWLTICHDQPAFFTPNSSGSSEASSLPGEISQLQPWYMESLRQQVALVECERLAAATAGGGDSLMARLRLGAAANDAWLQDYTHTPQVCWKP
jgi:hypothetical protein